MGKETQPRRCHQFVIPFLRFLLATIRCEDYGPCGRDLFLSTFALTVCDLSAKPTVQNLTWVFPTENLPTFERGTGLVRVGTNRP